MALAFGFINSGLFPESDATGEGMGSDTKTKITWKDVGIGIIPIGGVVAWCKSLSAALPPLLPNYVECNGQVLADGDSVLNGATIPDLNGTIATNHRFLRGQSTSGGTGGSETHDHTASVSGLVVALTAGGGYSGTGLDTYSGGTCKVNAPSIGTYSTLPSYYEVVWVMRIK